MSTAKETLEKIAKAIGIATEEPAVETVEETVETTEDAVEDTVETVEEKVEETVEDAAEATEEPVEALEEVVETPEEVVETPDSKEDKRVEELETQINELKEILTKALESNKDDVIVSAPVVEEKGLTHSPEAEVKVKQKKLGNKGGSIMSNVFKYINN